MLSDNLEALAGALEKYRPTGVSLAPEAVKEIGRVLAACVDDARRLEAMVAAGRDLPEGVSDLATRRAVVQMRSWTAGGGDAA